MREALLLALVGVLGIAPVGASPTGCTVTEATVEWGVKESFRSYLSGSIAQGSWQVSGDIGYSTPTFLFSSGRGFVSPDRSDGEVAFRGAILFQGHDGILNTTLGNPVLVARGSREATLFFDVVGVTMDGLSVDQRDVPFATLRWQRADSTVDVRRGAWSVEDAEVTLTQAGSEAFGTYAPGERLDPLSFDVVVGAGCFDQVSSLWWWIPGGAVILAIGVSGIVFATRRGRISPEPQHP